MPPLSQLGTLWTAGLDGAVPQISCLAVHQIRLTALLKGLSAVPIHLDFLHPTASINEKKLDTS